MKAIATLLMALGLLALSGLARAETRVMVVTDLHYLEPSLYQGSDLFIRSLRNGDGKMTQRGEELMEALLLQIQAEKPDALMVTGDLSFNGEQLSHLALAKWFHRVEEAGVPVWVIPGNHDIRSPRPMGFAEGLVYGTEGVTPEDFASIYGDFMGDYPKSGEAGFSYAVPVGDDLWVAMTDVSCYREVGRTEGIFTDAHAAWLEKTLARAEREQKKVITASHHNLLPHSSFSPESFVMFGNEKMAALARRYGVEINLCGHIHMQHIAREDGLTDAALGAFCSWPHRYAILTADTDGEWRYEARELKDEYLPEGFQDFSRDWFTGIARDKVRASLSDGTEEELDEMADFAARFHAAAFSGSLRKGDETWSRDPAFQLWGKRPEASFGQYLRLLMAEASEDPLHAERE